MLELLVRYLAVAGISQSDVAEALGLNKSTISRMFAGKQPMPLDVYERIEELLAQRTQARVDQGVREDAAAFAADAPPATHNDKRQKLVREIKQLSEAYKRLPRLSPLTDDEILGYDESGLPT